MATLNGEHTLQMRPKGHAHVANEVLPNVSPHVVDRGLQLIDIAVADFVLDMDSHAIVEKAEFGTASRVFIYLEQILNLILTNARKKMNSSQHMWVFETTICHSRFINKKLIKNNTD
ncbi:Hypothetical predicted protein [Octopus vulgaris]|uniref:Uncharacterized protein n=1 Tax=Octopus vulgaris TaxID=6645 RepID=A0AA36AJL1_OCTVU|nr:Hypothetical predicted protein [Octopus vulgaris]